MKRKDIAESFLAWYHVPMSIQLQEKTLHRIVAQSVQEAVGREFMKIHALLTPYISAREQRDIETRYKKPSRKAVKSLIVEV